MADLFDIISPPPLKMSFTCACCSKATKVFAKSCCKREGGLLICLDCSTKNYYVACERCREENLEANPDDDDDKDWCDCCDRVRFALDDDYLYVYIKGKDVIHVCLRCYKANKEHYDEIEEEYKSDDE